MTKIRLPSADVAEVEKRAFTEADVHSKLFEPDLVSLGYPPRTNNQADGEHFLEQGRLAMRRLRSRVDRGERGHYDGLYLIGNAPVVLCEIKRYDAVTTDGELARAVRQPRGLRRQRGFQDPAPLSLALLRQAGSHAVLSAQLHG